MIRSILIGAVSGARSLTPVAAVADAAALGFLPNGGRAARFLAHPLVRAGSAILAVGELAGDKMRRSPDRIVAPGLAARVLGGALTGAALAPRDERAAAAVLAAATAVGSAYLTFALRQRAMRRYGQSSTGLVEDAITIAGAILVAYRSNSRERS